jgi:hypothetical protein
MYALSRVLRERSEPLAQLLVLGVPQSLPYQGNRLTQIPHHNLRRNSQHAIPCAPEKPVFARISATANSLLEGAEGAAKISEKELMELLAEQGKAFLGVVTPLLALVGQRLGLRPHVR